MLFIIEPKCIHLYKLAVFRRTFRGSSDPYSNLIQIYTQSRALNSGQKLHALLIINGLVWLTRFAAKLIAFYTECKRISDARKLFDKIPKSNIRRWIVLIGAYARRGFHKEAMEVFAEMAKEGITSNQYTVPSVLKACGHLSDKRTGEKVHGLVVKSCFGCDAFVNSALIDMYAKFGMVESARVIFNSTPEKDLVGMNALASGYAQHGCAEEAWRLVEEMRFSGLQPNIFTWNILISGFSQACDEAKVSEIFQLMRKNGVEPDAVSWTSVISGFVQNFQNEKAFDAFRKMVDQGFSPTSATISSGLAACATVADIKRGMEIHGYALVLGVEEDVFVRSALIDMYGKCGFISEARTLFYTMKERNIATWNSIIFCHANHGHCHEAIELFNEMENKEEKLDHLTFTAVLTASCHVGEVELGQTVFLSMQEKYGIEPRLEHYACIVDLLGRAGKLTEAYELIQKMPLEPDKFVWGAFLMACRTYRNIELAEVAAKHLVRLEPESVGSSLLMSNLYADVGSWQDATRMKKAMKKRKVNKFPGCSWIEAV